MPSCGPLRAYAHVYAQVTWEAKQLEGTSEGDMGAKGAGGMLAVLDLRADESLQEAGFAREVLLIAPALSRLQLFTCSH